MDWIDITDKRPSENDGLIIVALENGFKEIAYFDDKAEELCKPWRFDKNDHLISKIDNVKYWFKLLEPKCSFKKYMINLD